MPQWIECQNNKNNKPKYDTRNKNTQRPPRGHLYVLTFILKIEKSKLIFISIQLRDADDKTLPFQLPELPFFHRFTKYEFKVKYVLSTNEN